MNRQRIAWVVLIATIAAASFLAGQALSAGSQPPKASEGAPRLTWNPVDNFRLPGRTYRAKVPGGWLLTKNSNDTGITFVPDPHHEWDGGSLP